MKFSISYKFKLKMAQNLSGRSGPVMGRSGPVGAGQGRAGPVGAGGAGPVPVGAGQGRPGPVGAGAGAASASSAGADRCRPVPVPLTDRKKRCIVWHKNNLCHVMKYPLCPPQKRL